MSGTSLTRKLPEDVDIIACTEEQVAPLRKLCKTSPQRIVEILRSSGQLEDAVKGRRAQSQSQSLAAALAAVGELVKGEHVGPDKAAAWKRLVDAGAVDALVYNVVHATSLVETLPGMPEDLKEKAMDQMQAAYYPAMEVLSNASRLLNHAAPTSQDKIFLSVLKASWSAMMERIWEEPLNSLREEESHVFERVVVAALFYRVIVAEPSFLDIAYNDLTIPVITRHWVYSGSCTANQMDAFMTGTVLHALVRPSVAQLTQYMRRHRNTLTKAQLLSRMRAGAGSTPYAAKTDETQALLDAFGTRFATLNGRDVDPAMEMALALLDPEAGGAGADAFARALGAHDGFWRGLFGLLRRIQKGEGRDSGGQPTAKRLLVLPIVLVSGAFDCVKGRRRGELLCTCARAGFFDALDETIDDVLSEKINVCELFAHLFIAMREALAQCSADEKAVLSAQFPRWRTMAGLFSSDIKSQTRTRQTGPPTHMPAQVSWQLFTALHVGCKSSKTCARRGCDKPGTARCATCKMSVYCGPECQKIDWKGHKLLCNKGWMNIVGRDMQQLESFDLDAFIQGNAGGRKPRPAVRRQTPTSPGLHDVD